MKNVPFLDLKQLFLDHREEFSSAMTRVMEEASFIDGPEVTAFERQFAAWVGEGVTALGCGNGTDAITLAAKALALPPDSEALVPAMTYMATAGALVMAGIKVRLVDVCDRTWLMDADKIEASLTAKTKLIAPVHLYGQMAEMDRIRTIADKHKCLVLEDAAQSHGAKWKGRGVGHWSDIATFSFYPGKNLGAFGDAGAVVSRDAGRVQRCRALAHHGGLKKYEHELMGWNSRLDSLQAAVLNVKLKYIDGWNDRRRKVAQMYREALSGIAGLELPLELPEAKHVYHLYAVTVDKREDLRAFLGSQGVDSGIHYPKAIHQQGAFAEQFAGSSFPNAEKIARHGLSLPMGPTLTDEQVERVTKAVRAYFGK